MKKETMRFLALTIISLFVISFLVGIVAAQTSVWDDLKGIFGNAKTDVNAQGFLDQLAQSTTFARVLIFFLVFIVVLGITDYLPFVGEKEWMPPTFAVVVSILSTLYLKPEEVWVSILAYPAMAMAITGIIPFMAVMAISKKLYDKEDYIFSKVIWVVFSCFLIIRWFTSENLGIYKWVYPIIILISLLMIKYSSSIFNKLFKEQIKEAGHQLLEQELSDMEADAADQSKRVKTLMDTQGKDSPAYKKAVQKFNNMVDGIKIRNPGSSYTHWNG